jgi:outer membrane immunogenic protein
VKKFVTVAAAIAVFGFVNSANAADMPTKAPIYTAAPVVVYNWTGLYIGGNIGGAWANSSWCTDAFFNPGGCAAGDSFSQTKAGLVGGGQIGARWQMSSWVFGIEAMFDALSISSTNPANTVVPPGRTRSTGFHNLYTVTGQVGYAWDRWLGYVKGGYAGTRISYDANNTNPGGFDLNTSKTANGWTLGAGAEYLVTQSVSVGLEYDYAQFSPGDTNNLINSGGVVIACAFCSTKANIQTVLLRANYKFSAW